MYDRLCIMDELAYIEKAGHKSAPASMWEE